MTDDKPRPDDETQPVRPEGAATLPPAPATDTSPEPAEPVAPAATGRRGFGERFRNLRGSDRDRTFGIAALIASALAGIIVGGLGAAAVHAVGDDRDRGDRMEQRGPMGDRDDDDGFGRGPMHGGMPGAPGLSSQVQPTTPPEDDDSSTS